MFAMIKLAHENDLGQQFVYLKDHGKGETQLTKYRKTIHL